MGSGACRTTGLEYDRGRDDTGEVVVKDLSKFRGMNPEELDFLTSVMKHHTFEEENDDGDPEAALLLEKVRFTMRVSCLV